MASIRDFAVALLDPVHRAESAQALAAACGGQELLIFVPDPELGVPLPANCFPATMPQGRRWRQFVEQCQRQGSACGELPCPSTEKEMTAHGLGEPEGSVVVLLGGTPAMDRLREFAAYLPFLGAVFSKERSEVVAAGRIQAAQQAAEKADALTQRLDATRLELQSALIKVETANRAKDEFLAMVSHELRTPLNAILGWASLLRMGRTGSFTAQQALETIELNAQSQARLIEDLLDFSRIVAGKLTLDAREVSMAGIIDAAVDTVRLAADARSIRLYVATLRRGTLVAGDHSRLQQVVWNLLSNAIKFTPEGGRVEITCETEGKYLRLEVRDTGPGIPPEFLPYVFDRFRQADGSSTRQFAGLGLGLAITRHLVELHGGTITAANGPEGYGALFTVKLPLAQGAIPASAAPGDLAREGGPRDAAAIPDFADLSGIYVLLVEDEQDALDMITLFLSQANATVKPCRSVKEALHSLLEGKPDVIVSDIAMPTEDGYSLMRKFRALEENSGTFTPAIALTSHASRIDRDNALAMGFQVHMSKPVMPADLVRTVHDLAHHPRGRGDRPIKDGKSTPVPPP